MPRFCRCGAIVETTCERCDPRRNRQHSVGYKTTKERGYGNDWKQLSERYRKHFPLCQVCEYEERVRPATAVHHIVKIADSKELRLKWSNLLAVCEDCHDRVEDNMDLAVRCKHASEQ